MTGAMKNAFGGLLHLKRHWTHSVIHETLVDLLIIQKEIHPGIFAVMDYYRNGNVNLPFALCLACGFAVGALGGARIVNLGEWHVRQKRCRSRVRQ